MSKLSKFAPNQPISIQELILHLYGEKKEYDTYRKIWRLLRKINDSGPQILFQQGHKGSKIYTTMAALRNAQLDLFADGDLIEENLALKQKNMELEKEITALRNLIKR